MFQTVANWWRGLVGGKSLALFLLAFAALAVWFFHDSAGTLSDYVTMRKQTWISPERMTYIAKVQPEVTQLQSDLDALLEKLVRAADKKPAREAQIQNLRVHRAALVDHLRAVKQVSNDAFAGEQAQLQAALLAARAALERARVDLP